MYSQRLPMNNVPIKEIGALSLSMSAPKWPCHIEWFKTQSCISVVQGVGG